MAISTYAAPLPHDLHGAGPPLVLLHGALVDRRYWRPQLAMFGQQHQLLLIDLPGHGESPALRRPTSVAAFAEAVLGTLDTLHLPSVACLGHSLGGMVAQELALRAPERISSLILVDTWYHPRGELGEPFPYRTVALQWLLHTVPVPGMTALMAAGLARFSPAVEGYARAVMARYASDRNTYLRIWDAAIEFSSRTRLHQISCPTLIMVGELYPFTQHQAYEMRRRIPNAELAVVPRSSHWVNWDNPEQFDRLVLDFLARQYETSMNRS